MAWYIHTQKFPKFDRYFLAQRVLNILTDLLVSVQQAQYLAKTAKQRRLHQAAMHLDTAKILIRLGHSLAIIPEQRYISLEQELVECGKMLGGWIRSLGTPTNNPD